MLYSASHLPVTQVPGAMLLTSHSMSVIDVYDQCMHVAHNTNRPGAWVTAVAEHDLGKVIGGRCNIFVPAGAIAAI